MVGQPLRLMEFQVAFILAVFDNKSLTSRAYLSLGRKNGKSALIAAIVLAHIVGPEARQNSQIISGARSREQAALVFKLMAKMIRLSPELSKITRIVDSQKQIFGLAMNVEYKAISAEAGTAHGLSPAVSVIDEAGQIKGSVDAFVEAIETAQGAHDNPLLIVISTQAATDADLFSMWLDDAAKSNDPHIVSHLYAAPDGFDLMDREAWRMANPALGEFRSLKDVEDFAEQAQRLPAKENSFRWLFANCRIEMNSPFVSQGVWKQCAGSVASFEGRPVFGGLDLSEVSDLTAAVFVAPIDGVWHCKPTFWLPGDGLPEKARADRVPYDLWHKQGHLQAAPGKTVDYEFVAAFLREFCDSNDVRKIAFDRYNWRHFKPWLLSAGFDEYEVEGDDAIFVEMGQGFASMSPALRDLESVLLNGKLAHGGHPVLESCARNATVKVDPSGNRKLDKSVRTRRIDGMVALTMAMSVAGTWEDNQPMESYLENDDLLIL